MEDYITLRIFSTIRLLIATGLFFIWIPGKIFPQEYIDNTLDKLMFNFIHMIAIITLLFPIFIYLGLFGFPFVILFFIIIKLLFLKYWYKRDLRFYLKHEIYYASIIFVLKTLDNFSYFSTFMKNGTTSSYLRLKSYLTPFRIFVCAGSSVIVGYALLIRLWGTFSTLVAAVSDIYQYYFWNQILKLNKLFDVVAGAPYPWGSPVLIYTVNLFARLNTVVLYGTFPLVILCFAFFSLYYFSIKLLDRENVGTAAPLIAILLFGVIIPSQWAEQFFGTIFITHTPHISRLSFFSFYSGAPASPESVLDSYPRIFFLRNTTVLPYEVASGFFLVALYFLHKALVTRKKLFLLLFAEALAIVSAIHPGVLIPLFLPALLVSISAILAYRIDKKTLLLGFGSVLAALILGNSWILQMLVYGIPQDIGAAAPILDKIFRTRRALQDSVTSIAVNKVQIVSPTVLLVALAICSLALFVYCCLQKNKEERTFQAIIPLMSIGVFFLYYFPNLGLPRIVDQSRLQIPLALSYSLITAQYYNIFFEKQLLRRLFAKKTFPISFTIVFMFTTSALFLTPRWIDDKKYWRSIKLELAETPYFINTIQDNFQPFSYTIISSVEGFSLVYSLGYHLNAHEFISNYSPLDKELKIPSDFVFIFVENSAVKYQGSGEFWYRWRSDIMYKLKEWIFLYGQNHANMKLWRSTENLQVYVIDKSTMQEKNSEQWRRNEDHEK